MMMGLLGNDTEISPLTLGLLQAGSALMSGGRQGLAQAPMAFAGGLLQGQEAQRARQAQMLREQMLREQMGMQREAMGMQRDEAGLRRQRFDFEMSQAAQEAARRQAQEEQQRAVTESFLQEVERRDPSLVPLARMDPKAAIERAFQKPEWRTWFDSVGRQTQGYVTPGQAPQQVGGAQRNVQMVNTGNAIVPVDPLEQRAPIPVGMSPAERDASARGWAGNAIARERLAMDRASAADPKLAWDSELGMWRGPPTPQNPGGVFVPGVGPDGQRIAPKDSSKPPTEGQSNAFLFANRAMAANEIINQVTNPDAPRRASVYGAAINRNASALPLIGDTLAGVQNMTLSDETQRYMQAKRDFINAILRKESGAVIGKDEFESADLQYFPQPGDSPGTIAQKADARRRAVEGVAAGAGPLTSRIQPPAAAQSAPADLQEQARRELERRNRGR